MAKKKVLLTGATGYVAAQFLPAARDRYDLVLLDVKQEDPDGNVVDDVKICDLSDPDRSKYESYFEGVDTVVHFGYKGGATGRAEARLEDYEQERGNVDLTFNVYRAAYDAGVKRIVVASSNHAADWYEHALIHDRKKEIIEPYELPLSDNFYGWAKATYEHMGFLFATGGFGRKMEIVNLRIGAPRPVSLEDYEGNPRGYKRDLGAYLSPRDLSQLTVKSIETENIDNEHGIPWLIVYGISDNTRNYWSLASAREVLGYEPEDDSEVLYAADVQKFLASAQEGAIGRVGV